MRQRNPNLCPTNAQKIWNEASLASTQITVQCELITPMYGGGVKAGVVDKKMPIRASALRGQLRFWWRLLNSTTYPNSGDLFNAESALWGGISSSGPQASQVTLQVEAKSVGPRDLISSRSPNWNFDYVLIDRGNSELLSSGYEFKLVLRFKPTVTPPQTEQVIEALRWWASFGGVGARTRRGLGAVKVTSSNLAGVSNPVSPVSCQEVKNKKGDMVLLNPGNNAVAAWRYAIEKLKDFRQGQGVGRRNGPGRSYWPEPDTIRRLSGQHAPTHPVNGYPRAAFGLPIVFHFKGGDPDDHVFEPECSDRMASPLILRPYFDGRQYYSLALLLPGWENCVSVPVRFDRSPQPLGEAWPSNHSNRSTEAGKVPPMNGRGDEALSAFLEYFRNP